MQPCLEPKDMVGKKITLFYFTEFQLVIGVEGGGYINIESHCDWDERSTIVEGEDLNEKQQAEFGLMSPLEYAEYLRIQEEKTAKLAEERRLSEIAKATDTKQVEINEIFTLAALIKRHPDLAKSIIDGTDYTGRPVRKATVEEIATMVSGELPREKQRFPR